MSFDEYQKSDSAMCMHNDFNRKIYEAGAQSRQAEIDELRKRIDLIVDLVRDNTPDYWLDNMIQDILSASAFSAWSDKK